MAVQIEGLVGENGILPISSRLALMEQIYSAEKFWQFPTIFWINASDIMLVSVCYAGMVCAILLLLNILPQYSLVFCYFLYLSIVKAGQGFTSFQWDYFLLEVGFLGLFLNWGSGIIILSFRWLLARFMFMGGVVKIASGDPSWANLTALSFHYETQPLPTPVAYYLHQLPGWFHKISASGVFAIELILPFFIFLPKKFRLIACVGFIVLQGSIILTGNYTFFNLLTVLLCLFLFDDKDLNKIVSHRLYSKIQQARVIATSSSHYCAAIWGSLIMLVCGTQIWMNNVNMPTYGVLKSLLRSTSTVGVINNYGPFAVMTRTRNEIIVEGSDDAVQWFEYKFKYKPGDIKQTLSWNIPHQPRLDWQMWFAALGSVQQRFWFDKFLIKLQEGSPQVLSLLGENHFHDKPAKYIRAKLYQYSFTSLSQYEASQQIWQRQYVGLYAVLNK